MAPHCVKVTPLQLEYGGHKMDWKKIGKALLFPHIAIMMVLVPVSTVFLVYSMVFLGFTG